MKSKRKFVRVHTRKIDREIAKRTVKKNGGQLHMFIKRGVFAKHWREYCGLDKPSKGVSYG